MSGATGALRSRIAAALQDSTDQCARCKTCDVQVDAVMAVLASEDQVAVSLSDLRAVLAGAGAQDFTAWEEYHRLSDAAGMPS